MAKIDFRYKAAFSNDILKRLYRFFTMKYEHVPIPFEIIARFWREKSQNLLV